MFGKKQVFNNMKTLFFMENIIYGDKLTSATVCISNEEFLHFSKSVGRNLSTKIEFQFLYC